MDSRPGCGSEFHEETGFREINLVVTGCCFLVVMGERKILRHNISYEREEKEVTQIGTTGTAEMGM